MKNRIRFAPSPTGFLHIGSLRTVIFNYLIAKKLNADFILRIEDTDDKRKVEGAVESLLKTLDWFDIKFDEGPHGGGDYGPYIQTERLDIYKKHIEILLKEKKAYKCFCTTERLEEVRKKQQEKKEAPRYDMKCRDLSEEEIEKRIKAGETYVIRQKMPLEGKVKVFDELRGEITFKAEDLQDHVLIKTNGIPTYQFASVVDDHLMEISHVTRSEEWIPSFPKNILLYEAFGWTPPKFIHYAGVLNKNGGKLSKRDGDVSVESYIEKGYLPEALFNFCSLLGWHPKDDNEILTRDEIVKIFEIKDIRPSGSVFDEEKLNFFNGHYIRHKDLDELVDLCIPYLQKHWPDKKINEYPKTFLKGVVRAEQERMKTLSEIREATEFFFVDKLEYDGEMLVWKKMTAEEARENLGLVKEILEKIPEENWTDDSIEDAIITYLKAKELKVGPYLWPMRVSLTGRKASPGPFQVAEVLGKEKTLERITKGIEKVS